MDTNKIVLPNGELLSLPQAYPEEEAKQIAFDYATTSGMLPPPEAPEEDTSDVLPSLERGARQVGSMLATTGSEIAGGLGFTEVEKALDEFAAEQNSLIPERRIASYKEGLSSIGSFIDYAQQAIAETAPSMGVVATGGLTGAGFGSVVPGVGTLAGGILGAFTASMGLSFGEIRQEVEKIDPEAGVSGAEIVGAGAVATLDAVSLGIIFKPVLGRYIKAFGKEAVVEHLTTQGIKRGLAAQMVRSAGMGVAAEAPTEAMQEGIEALAVSESTGEAIDLETLGDNMIEAALMGGIAGGFFGGVTGGVSAVVPSQTPMTPEEVATATEKQSLGPDPVAAPQTVEAESEYNKRLLEVTEKDIPNITENIERSIAKKNVEGVIKTLRDMGYTAAEIEAKRPIFESVIDTLARREVGTNPKLNPEIEPVISAAKEGLNALSPESIKMELSAREELVNDDYTGKFALADPLLKYKQERINKFKKNIEKQPLPIPPVSSDLSARARARVESLMSNVKSEPLPLEVQKIVKSSREGIINPAKIKEQLDDPKVDNKAIAMALEEIAANDSNNVDPKTGQARPATLIKDEDGNFRRTSQATEPAYNKDNRGLTRDESEAVIQDRIKVLPVPKAQMRDVKFFEKVEEKISKITNGEAKLNLAENLQDVYNKPVRGVQSANLLYVASNLSNTAIEETALHEAYHFMVASGALTEADRRLLKNEQGRINNILSKEHGLDVRDFEHMGPLGQEELQAELFGKYFTNPRRKDVGPLRNVFNKLVDILRSIQNGLSGAGFRTFEDLFESIEGGQRTPSQIMLDALDASTSTRFQQIKEEHDIVNPSIGEIRASFAHPITEDVSRSDLEQAFTPIQRMTHMLMSAPQIASFNNVFANMVNHFKERMQDKSALLSSFEEKARPYIQSDTFSVAMDVLDHMSFTEQTLQLDKEGHLVYTDRKGVENNRLTKEVTEEILGLQEVLKNVPKLRMKTIRDVISVEYPELAEASSRAYMAESNKIREAINDNLTPEENTLFRQKANLLEHASNQIKEMEDILASNKPYFPHMRFGDYGVVIENKNENGKKFFATIDRATLGSKWDNKQLEKIIEDIKADPELAAQYNTSKIKPFKLTYNDIVARLDKRMVTPELVGSLLGTGSEEYKKVAEQLRKEVGLTALEKNFKRRENLPGYSKDYPRVIAAYLSNASRDISNIKYAEGTAKIDMQVRNIQDTTVAKEARKYFEYVNDPAQDMVALRTFNFLFTMGGNVSTALLQFVTLPTTSVSIMMQWSPNFIMNNGYIAKNFAKASKLVGKELAHTKGSLDAADTFNIKYLEKQGFTSEQARILHLGGRRFALNPNLANESFGGTEGQVTALRDKVGRKWDTVGRMVAIPISAAEQASRIATLLSFFDSLNTPHKIEKAVKSYANDKRFNNALRRNLAEGDSGMSMREFISLYALEEAHAIFGKEGRGVAQRGLMGSLVFPFMTHPIQMMELLVRQTTERGGAGKGAAAYTLMAYITLAGLMGIPGMELMKELIEYAMEISTGVQTDIFNDITLALHEMGFDPMVGQFVRGGASRALGGVDIARRINLPVFFQNPLLALLEGDVELRDVAGVGGQIFQSVSDSKQFLAQGDYGSVAKSVMPVALKNLLKGTYDLNTYTGDGITTRTGKQILSADEATWIERMQQSTGFVPSRVASRREALYEHNLQSYGYRAGEEKYRRTMTNLRVELEKLNDPNSDQAEEIREKLMEERKALIAFRKRNDLPVDTRFWAGFNRGINARVRQRLHPDTIEPARRHIDKGLEKAF